MVVQARMCFRMDLTHRLMLLMRKLDGLKASLVVVQVRKWLRMGLTYRLILLVQETRRAQGYPDGRSSQGVVEDGISLTH